MLNDQLIDKRIVERNIKKGRVDSAEYARMLDALPDLSHRVWRHEEPKPPPPAAEPEPAQEPAAAEPPRSGWSDEDAQPAPMG